MADIGLVIKIPEETYNFLKRYGGDGGIIDKAVLNGNPLPKGHGDIGDLSKLIRVMKERSDYDEAILCTLNAEDKGYTLAVHHMIEESKECVIIEADKEGRE